MPATESQVPKNGTEALGYRMRTNLMLVDGERMLQALTGIQKEHLTQIGGGMEQGQSSGLSCCPKQMNRTVAKMHIVR